MEEHVFDPRAWLQSHFLLYYPFSPFLSPLLYRNIVIVELGIVSELQSREVSSTSHASSEGGGGGGKGHRVTERERQRAQRFVEQAHKKNNTCQPHKIILLDMETNFA